MASSNPQQAGYVAALPTFAEAAQLIGIDPSGISRAVKRLGIEPLRWGNRDKHLLVNDLLTIATEAHRHPVDVVAGALLAHVERSHPEQVRLIRAEIDDFLAGPPKQPSALPEPALPEPASIGRLRTVTPPEAADALVQLYLSGGRGSQ